MIILLWISLTNASDNNQTMDILILLVKGAEPSI